MRTIREIDIARMYSQPLTAGEKAKLARYEARQDKHLEHLRSEIRTYDLSQERARRQERQQAARARQQAASVALKRIHKAA